MTGIYYNYILFLFPPFVIHFLYNFSHSIKMSTRRHRNSEKANEWAKKRAEAVKLAKQRRAERKRGQVNEEHTFKPQQISKPPSRESGNGGGFQNHGHPGVYDRNGRDVYYDRQNKSYPIPQNLQTQNGNFNNNNFAPPQQQQRQFNGQQQQHFDQFGGGAQQQQQQPYGMQQDIYQKPKMSELDQLHMAGDSKFGRPRGYVPPVQQQQQGNRYQNSNMNYGGGYNNNNNNNNNSRSSNGSNNVEDELDRFYAGQFENMKAQQQNSMQQRPRPSLQTNNLENNTSRYGQVMSPNSDSLVHEARRVYNNPSIGRGGENDFLQKSRQQQQQQQQQQFNSQYEEENVPPMSKSQKHQQEADNNFQSWLRSDDDGKSKSINRSGWNSDFTDAGSLGRYEEPEPVKQKPVRRKKKPVQKKKPQWNNDWAGVESNSNNDNSYGNNNTNNNGIQRQQQQQQQRRQQPMQQQRQPQRGTYRTMINASDITGDQAQGSMTPPQVSSRLRLLKKKVKRKESFTSDYDDYSDGNNDNIYNNNDNYQQQQQQQQQQQSNSLPARRSNRQVHQQGWGANTGRSNGNNVNYGADNDDPFGQSKVTNNKSLSYHDIDNQPLGGGGGGGYNSRFDDLDDGGFVQEQQPPPRRQKQQPPRRQTRQQQQHQQPRRNAPRYNDYNDSNDQYGGNGNSQYGNNSYNQQQQQLPREQPICKPALRQNANSEQPPEFAAPVQLFACRHCGRKFNEKAHAKHEPNCQKVKKKRKPMDMTARRLEEAAAQSGNAREAIRNAKRAVKGGAKNTKKSRRPGGRDRPIKGGKKAGKWKSQSNALRQAMKQSRMVTKYQKEGRLDELPPMENTGPDPSFVPCPHCGRTFNEKAAERHIPRCKDIKAKPSFLKRGVGKSSTSTRRGKKRY